MHLDAGVLGLEVAGDASNGPPGAGTRDKGMQPGTRLSPNLAPCA